MTKQDQATILLYGDSIFWGLNAATGKRHDRVNRIDTVLREKFGRSAEIICEGHRGRTLFGENGYFPQRNGFEQFGPIFSSHLPIDVVVIMLGTNDLNAKTLHSKDDLAVALQKYKAEMQTWCTFMGYDMPKVVIVSPTNIDEGNLTRFAEIFAGAADKVAGYAAELEHIAAVEGFTFIDSRHVARPINTDGIHLDERETRKLADKIGETLESLIKLG